MRRRSWVGAAVAVPVVVEGPVTVVVVAVTVGGPVAVVAVAVVAVLVVVWGCALVGVSVRGGSAR
ncbi:hypothetical protein [Streptomyces sp. CFMR 7]|uniref:hypothetical protein n=1 Tax=Streptomyces sp. CFMR 7 TaxID=1649184 RepID=UPI00131B291E|nr:hypothetical protein [Streptomyces sp. CFMR 7]